MNLIIICLGCISALGAGVATQRLQWSVASENGQHTRSPVSRLNIREQTVSNELKPNFAEILQIFHTLQNSESHLSSYAYLASVLQTFAPCSPSETLLLVSQLDFPNCEIHEVDLKKSLYKIWMALNADWFRDDEISVEKMIPFDYLYLKSLASSEIFRSSDNSIYERVCSIDELARRDKLTATGIGRLLHSDVAVTKHLVGLSMDEARACCDAVLESLNSSKAVYRFQKSLELAGHSSDFSRGLIIKKLASLNCLDALEMAQSCNDSLLMANVAYTGLHSSNPHAAGRSAASLIPLVESSILVKNLRNGMFTQQGAEEALRHLQQTGISASTEVLEALVEIAGPTNRITEELTTMPQVLNIFKKYARQEALLVEFAADPKNFFSTATQEDIQDTVAIWKRSGKSKSDSDTTLQLLRHAPNSEAAKAIGDDMVEELLHSPISKDENLLEGVIDEGLRDHLEAKMISLLAAEEPSGALTLLRSKSGRIPGELAVRTFLEAVEIPIENTFVHGYGDIKDPQVRAQIVKAFQTENP